MTRARWPWAFFIRSGAGADTNDMVRAADDLKGPLQDLSTDGVQVDPSGASLLWSDFDHANLSAVLTSELVSWPVTLAILVLAFGALVAAGLPLLLTLAGLVTWAGSLVLINHVVPVSIWAMNFAIMFALALGKLESPTTSGVPDTPIPRSPMVRSRSCD